MEFHFHFLPFRCGSSANSIDNATTGKPGRELRNWLIALALLFGFNFGLGWLLLR